MNANIIKTLNFPKDEYDLEGNERLHEAHLAKFFLVHSFTN